MYADSQEFFSSGRTRRAQGGLRLGTYLSFLSSHSSSQNRCQGQEAGETVGEGGAVSLTPSLRASWKNLRKRCGSLGVTSSCLRGQFQDSAMEMPLPSGRVTRSYFPPFLICLSEAGDQPLSLPWKNLSPSHLSFPSCSRYFSYSCLLPTLKGVVYTITF